MRAQSVIDEPEVDAETVETAGLELPARGRDRDIDDEGCLHRRPRQPGSFGRRYEGWPSAR